MYFRYLIKTSILFYLKITINKTAEIAEQYLTKGREFMVQGELCMSSWEKDGKTFSKYYIRGKDLQFLSSGKKSESDSSSEKSEKSEESEDLVPF